MNILLGDFNVKVGKEEIFKPTIGNESLHEISNDSGDRPVKFATSKILTIKAQCSLVVTFTNLLRPPLTERLTNKLTTF
jgi:hypothetical protein